MKALKIFVVVVVAVMMVAPSSFAIHEDDIAEVLSAIGVSFAGYVRSRVNVDFQTTEKETGDLEETVFGGEAEGAIDFTATSPMMDGGLTASAKVTLLMENGGAQSDDAWVALSNDAMELKMGRFEAEDLHGFGNDFYVPGAPEAPDAYTANAARGRTTTGAAVTMNTSDAMMVQVGAVYGSAGDLLGVETEEEIEGLNSFGIRPLVKFSAGAVTLTAGGEYVLITPTDNDIDVSVDLMGFGGKATFGAGAMDLGVAAAYGIVGGEVFGIEVIEIKTMTISGWMTMATGEAGTLGVGGRYTMLDVDGAADEPTSLQAYVSYEVKPFMNDNMQLDIGGGYGGADLGGDINNSSFGVAGRLRYNF
jgi:hypothetical protein